MQILWKDIKKLNMESLACPMRISAKANYINIYKTFLKQWITHWRGRTDPDTES